MNIRKGSFMQIWLYYIHVLLYILLKSPAAAFHKARSRTCSAILFSNQFSHVPVIHIMHQNYCNIYACIKEKPGITPLWSCILILILFLNVYVIDQWTWMPTCRMPTCRNVGYRNAMMWYMIYIITPPPLHVVSSWGWSPAYSTEFCKISPFWWNLGWF